MTVARLVALIAVPCALQAQGPSSRAEVGIDAGLGTNAGGDRTKTTTVPLSIRFGGITERSRWSLESRNTFNDSRLRGANFAPITAIQIGKGFGSWLSDGRYTGTYVAAGLSAAPLLAYVPKIDAGRQRFLFGAQAGMGARLKTGSNALRIEALYNIEQSFRNADQILLVPKRTSMLLRISYSLLLH